MPDFIQKLFISYPQSSSNKIFANLIALFKAFFVAACFSYSLSNSYQHFILVQLYFQFELLLAYSSTEIANAFLLNTDTSVSHLPKQRNDYLVLKGVASLSLYSKNGFFIYFACLIVGLSSFCFSLSNDSTMQVEERIVGVLDL